MHGVLAQTTGATRYIDTVHGTGTACTLDAPCKLDEANGLSSNANGDLFLIRILRTGGTVTLAAPAAALSKRIRFGAYTAGNKDPVAGTIVFSGDFQIAQDGQFGLDDKASVQFEDVTLPLARPQAIREIDFFLTENGSEDRIALTGTLLLNAIQATLDKLVVSQSFRLEGRSQLLVNELTVQHGATLTLGNAAANAMDARIGRGWIQLVMKRGDNNADRKGILTVNGTIEGEGNNHAIWIGHRLAIDGKGRSLKDASHFHTYDEYMPSDGVDYQDCLRITGLGTVRTEIRTVANGNICVDLKKMGKMIASGSVVKSRSRATNIQQNITADIIFREDVIIDGTLEQRGDSRIVFEKTATIKGDVILRDDASAGNAEINQANYGFPREGSIRKGIQIQGGNSMYTCEYVAGASAAHIPGVQFEGAVTIEGELDVRSGDIANGAPNSDKASAPECAPRVLFMAPEAKSTTPATGLPVLSSIAGDLAIEDTADFYNKGRVYLDSDVHGTGAAMRRTVHSVQVGGDLVAGGNTIGMASPAMSKSDGICAANDTSLTFGNRIVLTDAAESVVIGDATNGLTLDALVTLGDLRVEPGKGTLTVTTLHAGPRAELMAKNVKVTESLILQGELSGELDAGSTVKKLTYGNRNTDVVKNAALHTDGLDALAIHIGSGELRLDEVVKTKNLGLCSGTLPLVDAESTTDSTLHVTEQITVQNGMLEKDTNDPGSISTDRAKTANINDRYILTYITPGKRTVTDALEWFDPRDVEVDHKDAEITASGDRSIVGKLTITKGKLTVDGMLTVGTSTLHRTASSTNAQDALAQVNRYSVEVTAGELQTEGQDVMVHGKVTVNGKSKLVTGGGDLHVLGRVQQGKYTHNTAQASIAKDAMINLGDGTLMLGPATTSGKSLKGGTRPDVLLTLHGGLEGRIQVPKGSKETTIDVATISSDSTVLGTILFDGMKTTGTGNENGMLTLKTVDTAGKKLVIDSLSAMHGSVELEGTKVVIRDSVALRSATLKPHSETTEFRKGLTLHGTGGLNADVNTDTKARSVLIYGDFMQRKGTTSGDLAGVKLDSTTTKTVMGRYVVDSDTVRYVAEPGSRLILHGDFHFVKKGNLNAQVEFKGKQAQEVMIGDSTALHSVTVNNAKGLLLKSHVMQQKMATLTLRQGKIHSMPMDSMFMWTVQNVQVEQELRGRSSAQEGEKCGADNDEECKATILRGSRQSYVGGPVVRHLLQGTAGAGFASGGYLFPVGMEKGDMSHYRPLILQLPSDLTDTTAATVSPMMVPDGAMPAWQNLTVPTAGGGLTLDVHADLFWKVDLGTESLPTNTNLRIAAEGLQNVADASGLRIVQWDCMWENPKLAGRRPAQAEAGSFAVNGYLSGVLHLTQEGIELGSCAIFGIAANGIANPIDQADLSGGRANLQFIHNVPLPTSVDLHLGDIQIGSGIQFRHATAYRPVGAGSHDLKIQEVGGSAEQAITTTLSLLHDRNYVVIAHGSQEDTKLKVLETRMTSQVANQVDVLLVHGSADLGAARVEVLDPADPMTVNMTLAGNLMLDEATRRYTSLNPSEQVFRVKSVDQGVTQAYEMNLYGYAGQTLVLNLSGMRNDLTILGVDKNGMIIPTVVVTGVEESAELPTEFALHGNYPNPFNPSTKIQFDLPENAQVQIQIVDMLGREVMTLPVQEMEAGANRSLELHATSLASGTYLYRIMVTGAEQRHVKTGRMTLVK